MASAGPGRAPTYIKKTIKFSEFFFVFFRKLKEIKTHYGFTSSKQVLTAGGVCIQKPTNFPQFVT